MCSGQCCVSYEPLKFCAKLEGEGLGTGMCFIRAACALRKDGRGFVLDNDVFHRAACVLRNAGRGFALDGFGFHEGSFCFAQGCKGKGSGLCWVS